MPTYPHDPVQALVDGRPDVSVSVVGQLKQSFHSRRQVSLQVGGGALGGPGDTVRQVQAALLLLPAAQGRITLSAAGITWRRRAHCRNTGGKLSLIIE